MNFNLLKNLLDDFVSDGYAPGNSVLVYLKGNKVFEYSCGYSDVENKIPMTGNEHVFLYSCSKITTVVAALQLLEQGKYLLSDPLYEYIPQYDEMYFKNKEGNIVSAQNHITIKNLFNMTAGFSYNTELNYIEKAREITDGKMNTSAVIKCLADEPLLFEPGEQDIDKAQMCCIAKDGRFINVGLSNSLIFGTEYDSGGAGIISSPQEYVKIAVALANYGTGMNGERILSSQTVNLMRTNTLDEKQIKSFNWKSLMGYGLGVRTMVDRINGSSIGNIGEFGWCGAAGSAVYIDPQNGLAALYAKHTLNPREEYYMPRVRNCIYACL